MLGRSDNERRRSGIRQTNNHGPELRRAAIRLGGDDRRKKRYEDVPGPPNERHHYARPRFFHELVDDHTAVAKVRVGDLRAIRMVSPVKIHDRGKRLGVVQTTEHGFAEHVPAAVTSLVRFVPDHPRGRPDARRFVLWSMGATEPDVIVRVLTARTWAEEHHPAVGSAAASRRHGGSASTKWKQQSGRPGQR